MASNIKTIFTENFTGGMNDAVPPDMLAENEVSDVTNFLPLEGSTQLVLRKGIDRGMSWGGPVLSMFIKRKTDGSSVTYAAVLMSGYVYIRKDVAGTPSTVDIILNETTVSDMVWFCNWDGNAFFYSDGKNGLYHCDAGTDTVTRVQDANSATKYYPSSALSIYDAGKGTIAAGAYTDLAAEGGTTVQIDETATTPGIALEVTIDTGTKGTWTAINQYLNIYGYYSGSTSHSITVSAYNTNTTNWDTIGTMNHGTEMRYYRFSGLTLNHMAANGDMKFRFTHTQAGNAAHKLYLDYIYVEDMGPNVTSLKSIVQHKGRLWGYYGNRVYFCGTDDDTRGEGLPRWKNWSPRIISAKYVGKTWETRAEVGYDDGSSMMIPPYGTNVTGLRSSANGLIVFKDRSIALWTYPDAAAPYEVLEGATIDTIASGVGCVSSNSLANDGDTIYFIGSDDTDRWSLYRYEDSRVEDVGFKIKNRWKTFKGSGIVCGDILANRYYVIGDSGIEMVYDINFDSWWKFSTNVYIQCSARGLGQGYFTLGGSDHRQYVYPSTEYRDQDPSTGASTAIPFSITSRFINPDGAFREAKFREVYMEGGANGSLSYPYTVQMYGGGNQDGVFSNVFNSTTRQWLAESGGLTTYRWSGTIKTDTTIGGVLYRAGEFYDGSGTWLSESASGGIRDKLQSMKSVVNFRTQAAAIKVSGSAAFYVLLNKLGFGYRSRQVKD